MFKILLSISLISFSIVDSSLAQLSFTEPTFSYDHKELWFDRIVSRENTNLINGPEYFIPFQAATTHPFFGSRELTDEQLQYDHQQYKNVPILYDIFNDILILRLKDKNSLFTMIQIDKSKVEYFTLYQHNFRKLTNPKELREGPAYYDILYEGKNITLVAKRGKSKYILNEKAEFQLEEKFYLIRNNQWSRLTGIASYYELMESNKASISNFIKLKNIKVRKQNESDMITIAAYCNSLDEIVLN